MIIVRIVGGLGNQLFQYSFAKSLSYKYNKRLFIDNSLFNHYQSKMEQTVLENSMIRDYQLKYFNIRSKLLNRYFGHLIFRNLINNRNSGFLDNAVSKFFNFELITPNNFSDLKIAQTKNIILDGYWQNQEIIEEYKQEMIKEFKIKKPLSSKYREIIKNINATNSVAVHVRRGDYIDNTTMKEKFVECDTDYYNNSMNYLNDIYNDSKYYVFSDDIEWSKSNLNNAKNVHFVDIDGLAYEHLYLMSQCKHQIIANSTFSWWAAWLNTNSSKLVLYPKNWYYDKELNNTVVRVPSNWIEIENKI